MQSLIQYLNEALILELSSELLGRASKAAREKGRNSQANRFAIAAGKALEKELKGWKPGPDAKNCGKVVATIKDMTSSNSAVKALAKADPASDTHTIKFPVLKQITSGSDDGAFKFLRWKDVKVPYSLENAGFGSIFVKIAEFALHLQSKNSETIKHFPARVHLDRRCHV